MTCNNCLSELLTKKGLYNNKPVTVIKKWDDDYSKPSSEWSQITIRYEDNTTEVINLCDFKIPYCLKLS